MVRGGGGRRAGCRKCNGRCFHRSGGTQRGLGVPVRRRPSRPVSRATAGVHPRAERRGELSDGYPPAHRARQRDDRAGAMGVRRALGFDQARHKALPRPLGGGILRVAAAPPREGPTLTPGELDKACALLAAGGPVARVGRLLDVMPPTIRKAIAAGRLPPVEKNGRQRRAHPRRVERPRRARSRPAPRGSPLRPEGPAWVRRVGVSVR